MSDSDSSVRGDPGPVDDASDRSEASLLRWDAALQRVEAARRRVEAAHERAEAAWCRAKDAQDRAEHFFSKVGGLPGPETDERERIADQREADADERERIADQREADADERERIADQRQADADEREDRLYVRRFEARERERDANRREVRMDDRERRLREQEAEFAESERVAEQDEISMEVSRSAEQLRGAIPEGGASAGLADTAAALRARTAEIADRLSNEAEEFAAWLEDAATRGHRQHRLAAAEKEREFARRERQNAARLRDLNETSELPGADSAPEDSAPQIDPSAPITPSTSASRVMVWLDQQDRSE